MALRQNLRKWTGYIHPKQWTYSEFCVPIVSRCFDNKAEHEMEGNTVTVCDCQDLHKKNNCRNKLLFISSVIQWMLMIVCIACIAMLFLYTDVEKEKIKQKTYVSAEIGRDSYKSGKLNLTHRSGNLIVANGSVVIATDGHYLVYLEGYLRDKNSTNTVTVWRWNEEEGKTQLMIESINGDCIRTVVVKELMQKDKIYIEKQLPDLFSNFSLFLYTTLI
ncbi:hypothetical protein XELAEV_18023380mg [Xenopus laevis]|uniref:TNF family profile domain-containing protein n=1 Tax=Xenopus laevis TaxID=8355 RepID=A0A974HPM5_XENLA|nr:hypothetical protein XELAEV_18023380mg [Xenopus laevis]